MRRPIYFFVLLLLALPILAQAQSGCCSSHGGVCGCACCDGTPLSEKCRPYFPCTGGKPSPPNGLSGTASSRYVVLTWKDNSSNETSFRIEIKSETDIVFREITFVIANVTSVTITGLTPGTTYFFRVRSRNSSGDSGYSTVKTIATLPETAVCEAPAACFLGNRFKVEARWQTPEGASGPATVVRLTDESGYLWFFNASNVEAVIKILNACSVNAKYWFFAGGLTNVQTEITVTDTATGAQKIYTNPQNTAFRPVQDTAAFATCP
ncbi:MAG TPA: fibronectin type III domain-containing protein [Thermoanaerobaculia bacterium]|nr:fibronectin type III domain-containing protein [Thermoanaerobaculia bacterium]